MPAPLRVLYIDDDPCLLDIGKMFLERSGGFLVTTAPGAPEAIRLLEHENFDAIISDYQMPVMDGIQCLIEVRTRFGPTPFILFTGRGREEIAIRAINSGADFYVQKGGEPKAQFADLAHKISLAVERKKTEHELQVKNDELRASYEQLAAVEEELRSQFEQIVTNEQAVRSNEERLIMAQEISCTGCWEYNIQTGRTWGSAERQRIFGYPAVSREVSSGEIETCIPDRERVHNALHELITNNHEFDIEYEILPADGSAPRIVHSKARLEKNPQGNAVRVVGVIQDITPHKQNEYALRQANRKLSILSGCTLHDINNKLTGLSGYLSILQEKQPDPALHDYFRKASDTVMSISSMIHFAREYESIGVNYPSWQDCRALVDTAVAEASPGSVRIKNDLPGNIEIFADPLIARVFYNLIDNAVRHGRTITGIRFFTVMHGDCLVIICEDNGSGIRTDNKERIFDRGFGENTGLGLAFSREILDITGITIHETGAEGTGARFEIVIPKGALRSRSGSGDSRQQKNNKEDLPGFAEEVSPRSLEGDRHTRGIPG
ncbi:MAG: response regulator [Methanoregula sp.]|nr:response regulator [Methanoregula sp.]